MHSATARGEALAVLSSYQRNRARHIALWLAWAGGILRHAARLRPDDEGLQVAPASLATVLKRSTKDIFRLVVTDDVEEVAAGHGIPLTGTHSLTRVVTRLLASRGEVTAEDLAGCGLGQMDEQARDRLCERLNAVLFRPWVDLSPMLEERLLADALKALKEMGDKASFRDALKTAARSGDYGAVAALMSGQIVERVEEEEKVPEPLEGGFGRPPCSDPDSGPDLDPGPDFPLAA